MSKRSLCGIVLIIYDNINSGIGKNIGFGLRTETGAEITTVVDIFDIIQHFVYFQVNTGVLYCFWIMKILIIVVLCCARFNYCIGFVFIV